MVYLFFSYNWYFRDHVTVPSRIAYCHPVGGSVVVHQLGELVALYLRRPRADVVIICDGLCTADSFGGYEPHIVVGVGSERDGLRSVDGVGDGEQDIGLGMIGVGVRLC